MEAILSRIELARKNQTEGLNPAAGPGYLGSVSDDPPVEQSRLAKPRPAKEVKGKGNLRSVRGLAKYVNCGHKKGGFSWC